MEIRGGMRVQPLSLPDCAVFLGFWLSIPTVFWLGYRTFCFDVGRVLQRPTENGMSLSRPYFPLGKEPSVLLKSPVCVAVWPCGQRIVPRLHG